MNVREEKINNEIEKVEISLEHFEYRKHSK